jgi:DNA-directed RNA polymerase specialized sigma24 family protein
MLGEIATSLKEGGCMSAWLTHRLSGADEEDAERALSDLPKDWERLVRWLLEKNLRMEPAAVDDVWQDTLLQLWVSRHSLSGPDSRLKQFLVAVAKNKATDYLRQATRVPLAPFPDDAQAAATSSVDPAEGLDAHADEAGGPPAGRPRNESDRARILREHLERQRPLVRALAGDPRLWEPGGLNDVAREHGIKPNTAKVMRWRLVQGGRKALEKNGYPVPEQGGGSHHD